MARNRLPLRLGLTLSLLTAGLAVLLTSALPVVLDLRTALLVFATAAAILCLAGRRRSRGGARRLLVTALAVGMLAAASLAAWDLTLAYRAQEVSFASGGVTLRGTLYLPRGAGRQPGIVLVHGAGRQTRREYRFYARAYAREGVAALAYDKRGSGSSEGMSEPAAYETLAGDALRAVETLRGHPLIDPGRVGLWGLSEGEWVAPLAALRAAPAFVVLVSPSAMTPAEQVRYEVGANVRRAGFGEPAAREAAELYGAVSRFERTGQGRDELNGRLHEARSRPWFGAARYLEPSVPEHGQLTRLPWFPAWRARMDFDALPLLSELRCPVLAQVGGADPKNDGPAALERIRTALGRGGNTRFTGVTYPKAAHGMIEWRLPFGLPPPWLASGYLRTQLDWVRRQANSGAAASGRR